MKHKTIPRLIAILLSLSLIVSIFPLNVFANDLTNEDGTPVSTVELVTDPTEDNQEPSEPTKSNAESEQDPTEVSTSDPTESEDVEDPTESSVTEETESSTEDPTEETTSDDPTEETTSDASEPTEETSETEETEPKETETEISDEDLQKYKMQQGVYEEYIKNHADPSYVGTGELSPYDFISVKQTLVDGAKLAELGGEPTINGLWTDLNGDGYSDFVDAFITQQGSYVYLYEVSKDANYLVGYVETLNANSFAVADVIFAVNDLTGNELTDCIYDANTGLVYVPKAHSIYEDANGKFIYLSVKVQLLYLSNVASTVSDGNTTSSSAIFSKNITVEIAESDSFTISADILDTYIYFKMPALEDGLEIDYLTVNGCPLDPKDWSYSDDNSMMIAKQPSNVDTISIILRNTEDETSTFGDVVNAMSVSTLGTSMSGLTTYYKDTFEMDAAPVTGSSVSIGRSDNGVSYDIYANVTTTYGTTKHDVTPGYYGSLFSSGSINPIALLYIIQNYSGQITNSYNASFDNWAAKAGGGLYKTFSIPQGSYKIGSTTMTFPAAFEGALDCAHAGLSADFKQISEDKNWPNYNYTDPVVQGVKLTVLKTQANSDGKSGSMMLGVATPTTNTQAGAGAYLIKWQIPEKTGSLAAQKYVQGSDLKSGWVFEIYSNASDAYSRTNRLATAVTDANGVATFNNLEAGKFYYIMEAVASEQTNDTTNWTLSTVDLGGTVVGGTTVYASNITGATITNVYNPKGSLAAQKYVQGSDLKSGWVFEIYSNASDAYSRTNRLATAVTDANGVATFNNLEAGKFYYIMEAVASEQTNDTTNWTLSTVDLGGTVVGGTTVYASNITGATITNVYNPKGSLAVSKTTTGSSTISGWVMELYGTYSDAANRTNRYATAITNGSGVATFSNLQAGSTYYVREAVAGEQTNTTAGWTLANNILSGTVVANTTTSVGTLTNTASGNLSVTKAAVGSSSVSGWVMELYGTYSDAANRTNRYATATTNGSGVATFYNLVAGYTYYIREAPASSQSNTTTGWTLTSSVLSGTVSAGNTMSVGTLTNDYRQYFTLTKSPDTSAECWAQIKDNPMYSLAGAKYDVYVNGQYIETLTTDANGQATSSRAYTVGSTVMLKETVAPKGFKLNTNPTYHVIIAGSNNVSVKDEPVFDPPFVITKVDKNTTTAQGDTSLSGAVFKWEYYMNDSWSGNATRTWYFRTDKDGSANYTDSYLALSYTSDALFYGMNGDPSVPLGTVKITEIENSLGYVVLPEPLYLSVVEDATSEDGATFVWSESSLKHLDNITTGNVGIYEPIDESLFGSFTLDKLDTVTGSTPQGNATLQNAKFQVINNSTNSVKIGDFAIAKPGEVCYEFYTDANGHFSSGSIFPIGSYTIKEVTPPTGYNLNSTWTKSFTVTKDSRSFSFTADNACYDNVILGGIEIIKQDSYLGENTGKDALLDGITFSVISNNDNSVVVNGKSYKNGETVLKLAIKWDGDKWVANSGAVLPYGNYTVKEDANFGEFANEYYKYNTTTFEIQVREQGRIYQILCKDDLRPGKITIEKVNEAGQHLADAKFQLQWSEDGKKWEPVIYLDNGYVVKGACNTPGLTDGCLVTDETGIIEFTNLYPGIYYRVTELEAPEGYVILTDHAYTDKLSTDTLSYQARVVNSKGYTLPNAGGPGFPYIAMIGTLMMGISGTVIVYTVHSMVSERKKKEKKNK